jgi:hypothetical protein
MKKIFFRTVVLFTFMSFTFLSLSQDNINVTQTNSNLISLNVVENNQLYIWDIPTIVMPKVDFEPFLVDCNKCICIRVFSPTKQFQDQAKALYFSHRCEDPCKSCYSAGGNSSLEWKAHYQRVYPEAQSVTIERSMDPQTIKNCGCNPF